jgi:hypothetical protein
MTPLPAPSATARVTLRAHEPAVRRILHKIQCDTASSNGSSCRPSNGDTITQSFTHSSETRHGETQALDSDGSGGDATPSAQALIEQTRGGRRHADVGDVG